MTRHQFMKFIALLISWTSSGNRVKFCIAAILAASAQFFQTVALFLPIKVLMLLGGGSTSLTDLVPLPFDTTVMLLAFSIPILYTFSILSAGFGRRIIVQSVIPQSNPFIGVSTANFVHWYAIAIDITSSALVSFAAFMVLLLISWPVAFLGTAAFAVFIHWNTYIIFYKPKAHYGPLGLTAYQVIDFSRTLVFLVLFAGLAITVVASGLNVYVAILALLVSRQAVGSAQTLLRICYRERRKANKLRPSSIASEGVVSLEKV